VGGERAEVAAAGSLGGRGRERPALAAKGVVAYRGRTARRADVRLEPDNWTPKGKRYQCVARAAIYQDT
jgi:hypothetical protein